MTAPTTLASPAPTTRRVVAASLIGTTIESYDLFIYGTAAVLIFPKVFFTNFDPVTGTVFSFLTFAASFVARPLGAIVLGHFGDRVGRKRLLVFSLFLMGSATFLIALLPGYDVIGPAAPILLVFLRICQGVGFGGEWGGAIIMVTEHAQPTRRALFSSVPQMGSPLGLIAANGLFLGLVAVLPAEAFDSWGWRIPFAVSIVLVVLGLYMRRRVDETPQFAALAARREQERLPFGKVLRRPLGFLLIAGSTIFMFGSYYLVTTFMLNYLGAGPGVPRTTALGCVLVASAVEAIAIPAFGALAGRIRGGLLMLAAVVLVAAWAFPMVLLANSGQPVLIAIGFSVFMIFHSMIYGPLGAVFPTLFETKFRYTGLGMGLNFGSLLGGGFAPLIATGLSGGAAVATFFIVLCAISAGFVIGVAVRTRAMNAAAIALPGE
jgi:MFS family permease